MENIEEVDLNKVDWKSSREFFESLGEALDKLDDKDESYNFTWVGKRKSIIEAGAPINKTLRPDLEASKNFDDTKNMLIVGDNLDALKLLQESYLGKIKMIYIDPPYNTGHDFVYHDNFRIKNSDYLDSSTDKDGTIVVAEDEFVKNSKNNGRFHSDWLSMIYPRLRLARNILSEDGVIFISIGEDENSNLKKVCDDIFGDDNFITEFIWEKSQHFGRQKVNYYNNADYILCYAKKLTVEGKKIERLVEFTKNEFEDAPLYNASNPENTLSFPKGSTKFNIPDGTYSASTDNKYYLENPVIIKNGINENDFSLRFRSRWSAQTVLNEYNKGTRYWVKSSNFAIRAIYADGKTSNESPKQILFTNTNNELVTKSRFGEKVGTNEDGSSELSDLGIKGFDYPKPTSLIDYLCSLLIDDKNDFYILDFFGGSGTTGESVLKLNKFDTGKRKYILVQYPEDLDENLKTATPESKKTIESGISFLDSINKPHLVSEITAERLRRAGDKIKDEHPEANIDTGFRVFRVDSINENDDIRKPLNQINQSDLFDAIDNIKKDRTPLDLLFGVVYVSALPFDLKLETRKIGENTVYLYGYLDEGTGLVACFDNNIPEETIKEIANLKALTAAFRDSSFSDSAAKINLSEHFRIISPDTKVKVI